MESIKKTGTLTSDPTVMKNGTMSYATFRFNASSRQEDGKVAKTNPAEKVYVVAFGGLADFAETSLRKGYTVTVTGQQKTGKEPGENTETDMVADEIEIVGRPDSAGRFPEPLKKSEGAVRREEYEENGGFPEPRPVFFSWEDDELDEELYNEYKRRKRKN